MTDFLLGLGTLLPYTLLAPIVGTITGFCLHIGLRFLSSIFHATSTSSTSASPPTAQSNRPKPSGHPRSSSKPTTPFTSNFPPSGTHDLPLLDIPPISLSTSPLAALLPPDSPLLSKYTRQHSPTSPRNTSNTATRPQAVHNISYRTQMRQLMTERQEQLIALHEEDKKRRQSLSPSGGFSAAQVKSWKQDGEMERQREAYGEGVSPLAKERKARTRPTSWPPLAVRADGGQNGHDAGRMEAANSRRHGLGDFETLTGSPRSPPAAEREARGLGIVDDVVRPRRPHTILEEDEDEEEDSDF